MSSSTPCKKCGQSEPVVTFRLTSDGYRRGTCYPCELEDQRARKSATPVIGDLPKTAMDSIRQNAPRMEWVRRAQDKEVAQLKKDKEQLQQELLLLQGIYPTAPNYIAPATDVQGKAVACAVLSDLHVEEPVDKEKVHGINEYNLEIAKTRVHAFFRNVLRLTNIYSASSDIKTIYLMILGDTFSNWIHEELAETTLLTPTEAANFAMSLLIDGINFLLENSEYEIIADCIPGNHGRITKMRRITNNTETSLETFMYQQLARCFSDEARLSIRVAGSKMLYRQFFDFTIRTIHGDDIGYSGGVGGITIPIRKKIAAWDKAIKANLTVMGHFHQLMYGGDFVVNGSGIGYNAFAQSIGASPEKAQQAFFILHEKDGGCLTAFSPVWLD